MSQAAPPITRSPAEVVRLTPVSQAPNGICYASAGEVAEAVADDRGGPRAVVVPFPSAEELEGKAPYAEVRFDRAGGRLAVYFQGRRVAAFADQGAWKEASLRIVPEHGPVRIESCAQEELRPGD